MDVSQKRHLAKSLTWRITATCTTAILTWIVTGSLEVGLTVGGIEVFVKMFLYYLHERIWYRSNFGLISRQSEEHNEGQ